MVTGGTAGEGRSLERRWVWVVAAATLAAAFLVRSGECESHRLGRNGDAVRVGGGQDGRSVESLLLPEDPSSRIVDLVAEPERVQARDRDASRRRRSVVLSGAEESGWQAGGSSSSGHRRATDSRPARPRPPSADREPWTGKKINQSRDSRGLRSATRRRAPGGSRILGQNGVNPSRTKPLRSSDEVVPADGSGSAGVSSRRFSSSKEAPVLSPSRLGLPKWTLTAVVPSPFRTFVLLSSLLQQPNLVPFSPGRSVPNSSGGAGFVVVCDSSKCKRAKLDKRSDRKDRNALIDSSNPSTDSDSRHGGRLSDKQVDNAKKDLARACGHKITHRSISPMAKSASMEMGANSNSTTLMSGSVARLRGEAWVVPLIILASINLVIISCFEAFVLVKMVSSRPSRRHFFLGQMLLLGLFLSTLISFAYVTPPNLITCTVVRLGVGLSYAFVFATLLVKIIFLISLNNGVYLPAAYHGLLLFFVVGVQVAVGVQWLIQRPPIIIFRQAGGVLLSTCNTSFDDMLISLVYAMFLLAFVTLLAAKSRSIRDNYREAMYIGLSVGCTIPLWVTWMVIALVLRGGYEEPCLAFGLVLNASFTFVIMFVPKGRQLAALGKEGLYADDHHERGDDRVSSVSPPSMYTPSFYHFKPALGPPREHPQGTLYKTPLPPERPSYPLPPPPRAPRYPVYPHGYYNYDDAMYYSMVRTMANNPNVHFVRNPMMY